MEVDSMHSTIEVSAKCTNVYVPPDWVIVIETANQTNEPYNVTSMTQMDIIQMSNGKKVDIVNC